MSTDGVNFSNWVLGSGNAQTNPIVDFNGFAYNFERGQGVSQPALCLGTYTISDDVVFTTVSSSNNGAFTNFTGPYYQANLNLSGGIDVCGDSDNETTLNVHFQLPFNAVNPATDNRFRLDVKDKINSQFHTSGTNQAHLEDHYFLMDVSRYRPNQPNKMVLIKMLGSRSNGLNYTGSGSIVLQCP